MNCTDCGKPTTEHYRIDDGLCVPIPAHVLARGVAGLCVDCAAELVDPPDESPEPFECSRCGRLEIACICEDDYFGKDRDDAGDNDKEPE